MSTTPIELQKRGKPTVTLCQSVFMELGRTEAKFFGIARLALVEVPHHPSGGARPRTSRGRGGRGGGGE